MAVRTPPYPTSFEALQVLVPGMGYGERVDRAVEDAAAHGFVATLGVLRSQVGRFVATANDPGVLEYCDDDERYGTLPRMAGWLALGRQVAAIHRLKGRSGPIPLKALPRISERDIFQIAHCWIRPGNNRHVQTPGAKLTMGFRATELGRQLAYDSRTGPDDKFRLGVVEGEVAIGVAVNKYDTDLATTAITLVTKESNPANGLYDRLGFVSQPGFEPIPCKRRTLQPVGAIINGHEVYYDPEARCSMVDDRDILKVLPDATPWLA